MKIAIIGSGISGLGVAYLLNSEHDIVVYEKNEYTGGHSRTVDVKIGDTIIPVDTGFIVFNNKNYPNLTGMLEHLKVPTTKSNMSFGVSIDDGWLEYGTQKLWNIFAQKRNLLRLKFWHMLFDIIRFNKNAHLYLENDTLNLGEYLDKMEVGQWFKNYYLLAMGGAIWSTPLTDMLNFPAQTFIRFFDNHGLLTVSNQPQWRSVFGGSKEYIRRISEGFKDKIKNNCGVINVVRNADGVLIKDSQGNTKGYDKVIFACHSDQTLRMLDRPTTQEHEIIGSIRYQCNEMILHRDISFMQKRRSAWSSWVYLSNKRNGGESQVSLSYWMNNLQQLATTVPIIVTLNPERMPSTALVYDTYSFEHPVFDKAAILAQAKVPDLQGKNHTYYCGAWLRYGFHEDGLLSAVNVANHFNITPPWN